MNLLEASAAYQQVHMIYQIHDVLIVMIEQFDHAFKIIFFTSVEFDVPIFKTVMTVTGQKIPGVRTRA